MTHLEQILCDEQLELYSSVQEDLDNDFFSEQKQILVRDSLKEWELKYDSLLNKISIKIDNDKLGGGIIDNRYFPTEDHIGLSNTEIYADFLLSNLDDYKRSPLGKLYGAMSFPIIMGFNFGAELSYVFKNRNKNETIPNWHKHLPSIGAATFGVGTVALLSLINPIIGIGYVASGLAVKKAYELESEEESKQRLAPNSPEMKYIKQLELDFYRPFEKALHEFYIE